MIRRLTCAVAAVLLLTAAAPADPAPSPAIQAAVAAADRPAADRAQDAARKPAETLAFAGVEPGMRIAELLPGGGYYTRILSRAVGPKGRVFTIPWGEFQAGRSRALALDPAYGNISLFAENLLAFRPTEPLDMVFTTQNYHDFASPQRGQINQVLFRALKSGGVYFILDHAAKPGSGYAALPLHRIDEALVRREVEAAGFRYVGTSEILRNPADDRTRNVFDPAIRGHTDQFLMKFVKP